MYSHVMGSLGCEYVPVSSYSLVLSTATALQVFGVYKLAAAKAWIRVGTPCMCT